MRRKGFTLIELTMALGIAAIATGGMWQLSQTVGASTQANIIASQAATVTNAARSYVAANRTAILAQVPAANNVVRIKINSADTGSAALTNLVSAGNLPSTFVNQNAYGQSYALYVKREDAGAVGVDTSDNLVALVITTGGSAIPDKVGTSVMTALGTPGGFMFSDDNPASPAAATSARGAAGGWSVALNGVGWTTTVGATATRGHLAILANMVPHTSGGSSGATSIDELSDGKTNYTTYYNLFMGGEPSVTTGSCNTGVGALALTAITTGSRNTALGLALYSNTTGSANTGLGNEALSAATTGSYNTVVGRQAMTASNSSNNTAVGERALFYATSANNTAVGYRAGYNIIGGGGENIALGSYAMYNGGVGNITSGSQNVGIGYRSLSLTTAGVYHTAIGNYTLYTQTSNGYNTAIGHQAIYGGNGGANTASGYQAMYKITTGSNNAAAGYRAGYNITSGSSNIALGAEAMYNSVPTTNGGSFAVAVGYQSMHANTGSNNSAVGTQTMYSNSTGGDNTAIGHQAVYTNTTSGNNTGVGYQALAQTTGKYSTAFGARAGFSIIGSAGGVSNVAVGGHSMSIFNDTGLSNTAIGWYSLASNSAGNGNVAIGSTAMFSSQTGGNNTAAGYQALYNNSTASNGTAVGYQALYTNIAGSNSTAVGYQALATFNPAASTSVNTAAGYQALYALTDATGNTAIGELAGAGITVGNKTTAVGKEALYKAATTNIATNNIGIGYQALSATTTGSYNIGIGYQALTANTTANVNVAVGYQSLASNNALSNSAAGYQSLFANTSGTNNNAIGSQALVANTTGSYNDAVGYQALGGNTTGSNNVALGYQAGLHNVGGSNNTFIGYAADTDGLADYTNSTALGYGATITASNQVIVGNNLVTSIGGYANWTHFSDRRLKHDIEPTDLGLDFVMKLKPVRYRMNDGNGRLDYGFIAQDVQEALGDSATNLVLPGKNDKDMWRFTSAELIAPMVKAIQELNQHNPTQAERIEKLKARVAALEQKRLERCQEASDAQH